MYPVSVLWALNFLFKPETYFEKLCIALKMYSSIYQANWLVLMPTKCWVNPVQNHKSQLEIILCCTVSHKYCCSRVITKYDQSHDSTFISLLSGISNLNTDHSDNVNYRSDWLWNIRNSEHVAVCVFPHFLSKYQKHFKWQTKIRGWVSKIGG